MASGPLHRPKLPGIPGIETFKGHTFHTSRWDYDYTGGDSDGNLDGLTGKRVGIIGTGATAVQCVPHLGEAAEQLYVFQRTPSSIDVRANRPTDPEWAASLGAGVAAEAGWTTSTPSCPAASPTKTSSTTAGPTSSASCSCMIQQGCRRRDDRRVARADDGDGRLREDGADPLTSRRARRRPEQTAEALKPYYRQFCKRPCFHDEYLDTFNRPNVTLVDTNGQGVDRMTEHGIVANGVEYEIDCLIFATGFEVGTAFTRRAGCELYGRGGLS